MSEIAYKDGLIVVNPKRPEWGPGRVVHVQGPVVSVAFRDEPGRQVMNIRVDVVRLELTDVRSDAVLDYLPPVEQKDGKWVFISGWKIGMPNYIPLWAEIRKESTRIGGTGFKDDQQFTPATKFVQLLMPSRSISEIHYEWLFRPTESQLDVALHTELRDQAASLKLLEPVSQHAEQIAEGVGQRLECGTFGDRSAQARFVISYRFDKATVREVAPAAASLMKLLIERTKGYYLKK